MASNAQDYLESIIQGANELATMYDPEMVEELIDRIQNIDKMIWDLVRELNEPPQPEPEDREPPDWSRVGL